MARILETPEDKLLDLKRQLENSKESKARSEGELLAEEKRMKRELNVTSIEKARGKESALNNKLGILQKKFDKKFDNLVNKYEW